ncbi:McrC family protein [Desulfovibrio sp. OttesenSCG-928-F20]|nr:McrC family protein [Desulfovibrio sp. OttesenSCG-928-F20]
MPVLRLTEYNKIAVAPDGVRRQLEGGVLVPGTDYVALKNLYLASEVEHPGTEILRPCLWKNREALQARNYVGVIRTPSGLSLEIYPKTCSVDNAESRSRELAVLLKMLCAVPDLPFQYAQSAMLDTGRLPLLEIFIYCFLQEIAALLRHGIASDYIAREENGPYLRGRLLVQQHLRHNCVQRHRFFVLHDHFLPDRPENRLIKTALCHVLLVSRDADNQRNCKLHLRAFDAVSVSPDIRKDSDRCRQDRNIQHYKNSLNWSRLLLGGQSPALMSGVQNCLSVLFPMEVLFERYVALKLRQCLRPRDWTVKEQAGGHFLVEEHKGKAFYALKPDLLLLKEGCCVIADTKWKIIACAEDIKRGGDLYQLFAYGEKCLPPSATMQGPSFLIYPKTDNFPPALAPFYFRTEKAPLYAVAFDLEKDRCPAVENILLRRDEPVSSVQLGGLK